VPHFVSINKAALLAKVQVKEIQGKINSKILSTTRGQIHLDDLVECYPVVLIEEADMLSLVAKIKEESFAVGAAKQHREVTYSTLKEELVKQKINANYYREQSQKFEEIIFQLRENLEVLQQKMGESQRFEGLIHWKDQRLKEIRRND